ncbi:MAG: sugar-binding domain-containing protein, partial [Bacteroidota bacterium]
MMRAIIPVIIGLLFLSCQPVKNVGREDGRAVYSLNGTWQFLAANGIPEERALAANHEDWDTLRVPGNWDTRDRYAEYVGKGYYQRSFTLPASWKGKQVRLKFGAVYQTSKVWVNGKLMGKHVDGYLPFEYNITDALSWDRSNSVVVMADNTYKR